MTLYLADTSAWHMSARPAVATAWAERLIAGTIATCAQVRLEVLYSAQSAGDYDRLAARLLALHQARCGEWEYERALEVQRQLGHLRALHHRSVTVADLVIAAAAEYAGATVWHYDEDFDRIAAITGQPTEWVAARGSL